MNRQDLILALGSMFAGSTAAAAVIRDTGARYHAIVTYDISSAFAAAEVGDEIVIRRGWHPGGTTLPQQLQ